MQTKGQLVTGPWRVAFVDKVTGEETEVWGIEEASFSYDVDTTDYEDIHGVKVSVPGTHSVSVELTLNRTDIPTLALFLPQYFVPQGGTMSTGETVDCPEGAIDIVPGGCEAVKVFRDVIFRSCTTPAEIQRMNNVRTEHTGKEYDGAGARKITVTLFGEPEPGTALVQYYRDGCLVPAS